MKVIARLALVTVCWTFSHSSLRSGGVQGSAPPPAWGLNLWAPKSESSATISYLLSEQNVPRLDILRGGGKGGCKVKHLSKVKEGRRLMMGKHAFPNLDLGARFDSQSKNSKALATVSEATSRKVQTTSIAMRDEDSDDSLSSWEVEDMNKRMVKRVRTMKEILPENGLIPLTNLGSRSLGALELIQTYKGRPIKILRRPRPPEFGDVWAWGSNYDGQLGIADGCRMDRWRPSRLLFLPDAAVDTLSAGGSHSLLLRTDGRVLACGLNACGQLGTGNTSAPAREFRPVTALRARCVPRSRVEERARVCGEVVSVWRWVVLALVGNAAPAAWRCGGERRAACWNVGMRA